MLLIICIIIIYNYRELTIYVYSWFLLYYMIYEQKNKMFDCIKYKKIYS